MWFQFMDMEKFIEYLQEAEKKIKTADHLIYMTYPLIQDKKIFLTALSEIHNAIISIISSILQYEYIYKRIDLSKDAKINLQTFINNCAPSYDITDIEIKTIKEIISLSELHRKSVMEFLKNDKIVILSEYLQPEILTLDKNKEFLLISKQILRKTASKMLKNRY